ncbi:MAG: hypothetical protein AUJ54_00865 [Ignavibacteria bacterium CG1_02_37_35]|nr:MAG: hypothetical protein AUJ54_00865 [Ignavibacteria bacterium CG1_02_37_35]
MKSNYRNKFLLNHFKNINDTNKMMEWMNENEWMNVFHSIIQIFNHSSIIICFAAANCFFDFRFIRVRHLENRYR